VVKTSAAVAVNATSNERASADAIGMALGLGCAGMSSATANVTNRTHAFTGENVQLTSRDITIESRATDYANATALRAAAGALVEGDLTTFSTLDTQSWASLGKGTRLTAPGNILVEAISGEDINATTTNYSAGALTRNKADATITATIDTAVDVFDNVVIDAGTVTLEAYVEKLFINANAYSQTVAAGSDSQATATVDVSANASVDVNAGADITGADKINIIARYQESQAQVKAAAKAEIAAGFTGNVTATSDADVAFNANVNVMKGSALRTDDLYVEATTSHNQQVSYQRTAVASAKTVVTYVLTVVDELVESISNIPIIGWFVKWVWTKVEKWVEVITYSDVSEVYAGSFTGANAVKLNGDIYQSSAINPTLVINPDGTFGTQQNVSAHLSGDDIIVDSIVNDAQGKIRIVAPNGSVSGTPTIHRNTIFQNIAITNNSPYDLIINSIDVLSPYDSARADISIQSAINTLNATIVTTSSPCDIGIRNNTASDIIFAGKITNADGTTNVFNKFGDILETGSGLLETHALSLGAPNGAIGKTSSRFDVNLVKGGTDPEISALSKQGAYLGIHLVEYKNSDVTEDYSINSAQLKNFLVGDVLDLTLGNGTVYVPLGGSIVGRERAAQYTIVNTVAADGDVNIAIGDRALLNVSGTLLSGFMDIDFAVDANGNVADDEINYSRQITPTTVDMENIQPKGGRVAITGAVTGAGVITVLDGYRHVTITNDSPRTLLLNGMILSPTAGSVILNNVPLPAPQLINGISLLTHGYKEGSLAATSGGALTLAGNIDANDIAATSVGALTLAGNIAAHDTTTLLSDSAILQDSGSLGTAALRFAAAGPVTLVQPGNEIAMLAGQTTAAGDIRVTTKNNLVVGTVSGVSGLTAQAGDIALSALHGSLRISQKVIAALGAVFVSTAEAAEFNPNGLTVEAPLIGRSVECVSSGDITLAPHAITSSATGASISTSTGSILATGSGPHIVAAGDTRLFAPLGTIGISEAFGINALEVQIDGKLLVTLGAIRVHLTSGVLGGTLPDANNWPILFPVSYPQPLYPWGRVYFNGIKLWPPSANNPFYLAYLAQAANTMSPGMLLPNASRMNSFQFSSIDLMSSAGKAGPVYFYHPLVETDLGEFSEGSLTVEMYEFIDGQIQSSGKKKRRTLTPGAIPEIRGQ
jgi:hypothetical protein